ncbi:MAG: hypothetical protein GY906_05840 [bacterium]|nr:hypothetical protein [bacterium]
MTTRTVAAQHGFKPHKDLSSLPPTLQISGFLFSSFIILHSYFLLLPLYTLPVELIADVVAWMEPRALILALFLPPVIRIVGHWLPEELFMISIGVLAARAGSPLAAGTILGAVFIGHFYTDQSAYALGRWVLGPRLQRFPRVQRPIEKVASRLVSSPAALLGFIPARILPLGRGAWLVGCGVVRIGWPRFIAVDVLTLALHVMLWCGLGWWMANDLARLQVSAEYGRTIAVWLAVVLVTSVAMILLWRFRAAWQPVSVRIARRASQLLSRPFQD